MSSIIDVNQRLLKIFGLEGQRVTSLTVRAEVDELPTLEITRLLIEPGDVRETHQVFDLQLRQETAAEPQCEAMARVDAWIEEEAGRCHGSISNAFSDSWARFDLDPWRYGREWIAKKPARSIGNLR